jgi:hypothetical protein
MNDLREEGFDVLVQAAIDGLLPASCLADLYELAVVAGLIHHYIAADGHELARIGGLSLKAAQEAFVKTDKLCTGLRPKGSWRGAWVTRHPGASITARAATGRTER